MRNWKVSVGLVLALAMVMTACGDDDAGETTVVSTTTESGTTTVAPTTTAPAATTTAAPTTTVPAVPSLVVWTDDIRAQVLEGPAADFEAATGIPVDVQVMAFDDISARFQEDGPAGEGPDVFISAHETVGELATGGLLAPIKLPNPTDYHDVAIGALSFDGVLYGVPYAVESMALYRNIDLVPEAPTTFTGLLASCEALGDAIANCLGIAASDGYANQAFVHGFGGYVFGYTETGFDQADVGLDSAGALAAADFLDAQVKAGVLDPTAAGDLFNQGTGAYLWHDQSQSAAVDAAGITWDASAFPAVIDGGVSAPFVRVSGFMVSSFSEQPVAAQVFLTEFVSNRELMFDFFTAGGSAPAHKDAYVDAVATDPRIAAFAPVGTGPSNAIPNVPGFDIVWDSLDAAIAVIYTQAYTDDIPDARAAFQGAADAVRAAFTDDEG